jgi:hypothetical protein
MLLATGIGRTEATVMARMMHGFDEIAKQSKLGALANWPGHR